MDEETFAFGPFQLIPAQRILLGDGKPLRLGSRALDILIALVERAGETVHKDHLIARTWPDTVVDEGALRVHVAALRKALGDGRSGKRYIANDPGRGYTFVAPVTREGLSQNPAWPAEANIANNLPVRLTRTIGRDHIVTSLATQLTQRRFVTIVGPGGIGKTTVAIAVAEMAQPSYPDGIWFVGLASLADPELVPSTINAVLGISLSGTSPLSALAAWLRDKHTLIVLDSCEHVIGAAAALAESRAESGAARPRLGHQPRTAASRRRMAAPPSFAGDSADLGRHYSRRGAGATPPSSCSKNGPRRRPTGSLSAMMRSRPFWRFAAGSTGSRWRSSWRRRASMCSACVN